MTTLSHACFRPRLTSKLFWMRANRILAWSLIASPPLQWALGMRFANGLLIDLAIVLVHGALSFTLFGKPETKARAVSIGMHVFGFRAAGMSPRNRFLLTAFRIGAGLVAIGLLMLPLPLIWLVLLYPLLRLPVSIIQHLYEAIVAAMVRWGMRGSAGASAGAIVLVYLLVSLINLVR
jgi:hypothetical protein